MAFEHHSPTAFPLDAWLPHVKVHSPGDLGGDRKGKTWPDGGPTLWFALDLRFTFHFEFGETTEECYRNCAAAHWPNSSRVLGLVASPRGLSFTLFEHPAGAAVFAL